MSPSHSIQCLRILCCRSSKRGASFPGLPRNPNTSRVLLNSRIVTPSDRLRQSSQLQFTIDLQFITTRSDRPINTRFSNQTRKIVSRA
jgi:hypothetical protein